MLVEHGADGDADPGRAAQRAALVVQPGGDGIEPALGGIEQFLPLVATSGGEVGIAADDEAFTGIVLGGDLGHIPLIEQGELQRTVLGGKLADGGGAQGGDPVETGGFDIGFEPGVGDHAAIADQHDAAEVEACPQFGDLGGERHGISRVAFEYLDGNGTSLLIAEQAVDDLGAIGPVVPAVAALRKFAVLTFEIA